MNTRRRWRGFTLVEMLVVIAIIGVLIALLLPAVNIAREAARAATCKNNLKNLALAVQQFESANNKLPPNRFGGCRSTQDGSTYDGASENSRSWSWIAMILPFLEQKDIYSQAKDVDNQGKVTLQLSPFDAPSPARSIPRLVSPDLPPGQSIVGWVLPMLHCPSDEMKSRKTFNEETLYIRTSAMPPPGIAVGLTNYKGVIGTTFIPAIPTDHRSWCQNDGILPPMDPQLARRFSNTVKDGLSQTFMIGEQVWNLNRATCSGRNAPGGLGRGFAWAHSVEASAFGGYKDDDCLKKQTCLDFPLNWTPRPLQPDAEGNMPDGLDDCSDIGPFELLPVRYNGFRSHHIRGAQFARCDASIVFVSNNVDAKIYRAQFTVKGGKAEGLLILDQ